MQKVLLFLSLLLLLPAFGFSAEKSYIVGFHKHPEKPEKDLILKSNGRINRSFNLIHALAVTLSEDEAKRLKKDKNIAYISEDRIYAATLPLPGNEYAESWGVKHIYADLEHANGNKGAGINIAVIDTGIDYAHEDLDDNFISGINFVQSYIGQPPDNNFMDDNTLSHGTHVAGIIAAEDNGMGVIGVAPEASLYAVRVLDGAGFGLLSWIISGIEWSVNNGMDIINLSLQGSHDPALEAACNSAYAAGVIIVSAAGNTSGGSVAFPAGYASVVAVTAINGLDAPANFSPVGPEIDVAAPGVDIQSTTRGDTYGVLSGTSQAAPHVAGVAALYLAAGIQDQNDNGLINDEIIEKIKYYAMDLGDPGFDINTGYGLVNAAPCPDIDACLPICPDNDNDGFAECDGTCQPKTIPSCGTLSFQPCGDCNDNDASINPDAPEICDTIDNNCNDIIDTDNETCIPICPDNDNDGFAECDGICQPKIITSCGCSSLQPCEEL